MFGLPPVPWGPLGLAGGTDTRPTNTPEDMASLQKLYAAVKAQNQTPNGRVARGFNQFGPQVGAAHAAQPSGPVAPMLPTPPTPGPVDMSTPKPPVVASDDPQSPGALSPNWAGPHSVGGAPLPNVGPTSVGGAPIAQGPMPPTTSPDMSMFARNAAMMRDPSSQAFIDPSAGDSAQASGPDVINKLMSYFKNKDTPS